MSDSITITGTVHRVLDAQTFASGFTKRPLVVDTGGKFDPYVSIDFKKDKVDLLNEIKQGQQVRVSAFLGGKEYNGKFYNDITGWRIEAGEAASAAVPDSPPSDSPSAIGDEDIPF